MRGFWIGLVVGGVAGAAATWALSDRNPSNETTHGTTRGAPVDGEPRAPTLVAAPTSGNGKAAPPASSPASIDPTPGTPPSTPASDEEAAYQKKLAEVRTALRAIRDAKPGSDDVRALFETFRSDMSDKNDKISRLAGRALIRLAAYGKLQPEQINGLADDYKGKTAGDRTRPILAATVALGWARDPKLAGWLRDLPTTAEPDIRATVVEALDESPSDAYRAYLLRLTKHERNADVLNQAWNEDPIGVALTDDFAPRLIAALEARIAEGDLPSLVRGRGLFAIGLASVHDSPAAQAAIENLAGAEPDAGVRAFAEEVLASIRRGEANVQALEGIWDRHRRNFASE